MAQGNLQLNIAVKNQQALGKVNKQLTQLQGSSIRLSTLLKGAAGALAAIGATRLIGSIINTTARFEDLGDALASVTGSAQAGAEAFDFVSKFATQTQFGVEDLTTTFIKLKASGIEPTQELLTLFTDTAAVTTDQLGSLQAITDLFARTTSGGLGLEELNRLADRGVPVFRILEEQLGLARLQISEVGKTAEGSAKILNALSTGLRKDFGGATANVVDNLSTQFSNLDIELKNAANTFGQGLSPALKDVVSDLTKFVEDNEELIAALGRLGGTILKGVVTLFVSLAKALGSVVVAGEKLIEFLEDGEREMDNFHDSIVGPDDELLQLDKHLRDFTNIPITMIGDMGDKFDELGPSLAEVAEQQANYNNALGDYNETGKTSVEVLKDQADEAAAVNRENAIMNRTYPKTTAAVKTVNKELTDYQQHLTDMLKSYSEAVIVTDTLIGMTNAFATTAESALTDVVLGTKTLKEALGEVGQAILRELVGGIIRLLVVGPLLKKIAEIFGIDMVEGTNKQIQAQKKLNSALKQEIVLRTILAFLTGGTSMFGGFRASGGPVAANTAYVVGEQGREVFIPNTSGTIVPNEALSDGGSAMGGGIGGDNIEVTFNINTIDATDFDQLLTTRQDMIIGLINRGLAERGKRSLTA